MIGLVMNTREQWSFYLQGVLDYSPFYRNSKDWYKNCEFYMPGWMIRDMIQTRYMKFSSPASIHCCLSVICEISRCYIVLKFAVLTDLSKMEFVPKEINGNGNWRSTNSTHNKGQRKDTFSADIHISFHWLFNV